ncbi:hypothetical protein M885DRAFT_515116 [Pelagophyceae sp. CCMP2097]|nr:hypothetical protein M885DRAFT_515116 [Pelagophyceae sp. CCMP2097]
MTSPSLGEDGRVVRLVGRVVRLVVDVSGPPSCRPWGSCSNPVAGGEALALSTSEPSSDPSSDPEVARLRGDGAFRGDGVSSLLTLCAAAGDADVDAPVSIWASGKCKCLGIRECASTSLCPRAARGHDVMWLAGPSSAESIPPPTWHMRRLPEDAPHEECVLECAVLPGRFVVARARGALGLGSRAAALKFVVAPVAASVKSASTARAASASSARSFLDALPSDVHDHVFDFAARSLADVRSARLICRALDRLATPRVTALRVGMLRPLHCPRVLLCFAARVGPRLASLNLRNVDSLRDCDLAALEGCPSLTSLNLGGCGGLTDAAAPRIAKQQRLRTFNLAMTTLSAAAVVAILHNLRGLAHLNLYGKRHLSDHDGGASVLETMLAAGPRLEVLNVRETGLVLDPQRVAELKSASVAVLLGNRPKGMGPSIYCTPPAGRAADG